MKPGLTRAVPMGIIGFILGALFTYVIRDAQGLIPVWDPDTGFILPAFISATAFIYGMGAFDPRMNTHPHEPTVDESGLVVEGADDHHDDHEEEPEPAAILSHSMWQASFWTIVVVAGLILFAALPTPFTLHQSNNADAAFDRIGSAGEIEFLGNTVEMTQLSALVGFSVVMFVSLAVIAGGIGFVMFNLNTQIAEAKASEPEPLEKDAGEKLPDLATIALYGGLFIPLFLVSHFWVFGEQFPQSGWIQPWLAASLAGIIALGAAMNIATFKPTTRLAVFVALAAVLYGVFYAAAIGLVFQNPDWLRVLLSAANAIGIPIVLVYPVLVLKALGHGAGTLAKILRGVPSFLGQ